VIASDGVWEFFNNK